MNSFGRIFKVSILGESHGNGIGIVIDGVPAGISLTEEDFEFDLSRRRAGASGTTPRKESDIPKIFSGIFEGKTTGAPLTVLFENNDINSNAYDKIRNTPRPGHADFVAHKKFGGFQDYRGGGHFSGRLTAAIVAAGVVAKKVISFAKITATLIEAGGAEKYDEILKEAVENGDSIGGIIQCTVDNLPVGLGEPFFDSVESVISHGIFSIPAIKGIEFGSGFSSARLKGSQHNDEILNIDGTTKTNNSGGINGGITNGNQLIFKVAVKPTSSIKHEKQTIDLKTEKSTSISVEGRHDACIAIRAVVVVEAMTAISIADLAIIQHTVNRVNY